jgi:predicted nucleotidyltransferase component of viral defense system
MNDWQKKHGEVIYEFLKYLNENSDKFVLKGGTALLTCYKLDRFSEDVYLDGRDKNIFKMVEKFCEQNGYSQRIAKDTDTVKRSMINYGNVGKPLKIEVSYRRRSVPESETTKINGISVYNINELCSMKANAYTSRDKIRDLYDLTFICNNYFDELRSDIIMQMRNAVEHKGLEHFDYILREQHDDLIDESKLTSDFLNIHEMLGLITDSGEIAPVIKQVDEQEQEIQEEQELGLTMQ